jgi:hypothetical protein
MKKDGSEGSKADDARPEAVEGTVVTHPEATKKHGETNAGDDVPPSNRA